MSRIEELERRVQQDPASIAFGALAEEYRRAGRLEDAIAICRAGLERHPSYLSARVTLGRALQSQGHDEEAREEFARVIEVAPDNLAAIRALAELGTRTGTRTRTRTRTRTEPVEPMEPEEPVELKALEHWLDAIERARREASERL